MKNEQDLNTIIKNSFDYGYKIPDPNLDYISTIKRPFDGFGIYNGNIVFWEAKYMNKLKSFDLKRIEDHQILNLLNIQKLLPTALCWIVLGVKVGRGDNRIYIFNNMLDIQERRENKKNFLKKELESLPYYSIYKDLIEIETK